MMSQAADAHHAHRVDRDAVGQRRAGLGPGAFAEVAWLLVEDQDFARGCFLQTANPKIAEILALSRSSLIDPGRDDGITVGTQLLPAFCVPGLARDVDALLHEISPRGTFGIVGGHEVSCSRWLSAAPASVTISV